MKTFDLDEVARMYPTVDRQKLSDALELLQKLAEEGIFPVGSGRRSFGRHSGRLFPDPTYDPRTVRLRSRI